MDVLDNVTSRETALQAVTWCINMGHSDALEVVFEKYFKDENLHEISEKLANSLTTVAKSGSPGVFKTLLHYVDDTFLQQIVCPEKTYVTKLLGHAVERGDTGMAEDLLGRGGDPDSVFRGKPLLHLSLELGQPSIARLLTEKGANVSVLDKRGDSVLVTVICSSVANKASVVQWLIDAGADINVKTSSGKSLLHVAAAHSADVIKVLATSGVDVNVKDTVNGDTPLHVACGQCCRDTIIQLIQIGAHFNAQNNNGETPLEKLIKFAQDQTNFHSKTRINLARTLLQIGFRMYPGDLARKRVNRKGRDKVADLYVTLVTSSSSSTFWPSSLQSLCRPVIRETVSGPGFNKEILQLDIPSHLKSFLTFQDGSFTPLKPVQLYPVSSVC